MFAGTSNKRELLKAEGGDRRFWEVEIIKRVDVEALSVTVTALGWCSPGVSQR